MFSDALCSDRAPLVSYYGAIAGLQELGPEVIKVFVLPHIAALAQKNRPGCAHSLQRG